VFVNDIVEYASQRNYPLVISRVGSIFWLAFDTHAVIRKAEDIDPKSMDHFKQLHLELLNRGVYMGPSGYEVGFISAAHTPEILNTAKQAIFESLDVVFNLSQPSPMERALTDKADFRE
jgi:glutamate-1-semialdehyde 2,1-aminomutase